MKKFVAPSPEIEVSGYNLQAFVKCTNHDHIEPVLIRHGFAEIDPQSWYPMQPWLNVFKDISTSSNGLESLFDFVSIGMALGDQTPFPPSITNFIDAIKLLPRVYAAAHRNAYAGEFVIEEPSENKLRVIKSTPYPDGMTFGLLRSVVRRFADNPGKVRVYQIDPDVTEKETETIFEITW